MDLGLIPVLTVLSDPALSLGGSCLFKTPASSPLNKYRKWDSHCSLLHPMTSVFPLGSSGCPQLSWARCSPSLDSSRSLILSEPPQHLAVFSSVQGLLPGFLGHRFPLVSRVLQKVLFEKHPSFLPLLLVLLSPGAGRGAPITHFRMTLESVCPGLRLLNSGPSFQLPPAVSRQRVPGDKRAPYPRLCWPAC